jgi:hypothetical protein
LFPEPSPKPELEAETVSEEIRREAYAAKVKDSATTSTQEGGSSSAPPQEPALVEVEPPKETSAEGAISVQPAMETQDATAATGMTVIYAITFISGTLCRISAFELSEQPAGRQAALLPSDPVRCYIRAACRPASCYCPPILSVVISEQPAGRQAALLTFIANIFTVL